MGRPPARLAVASALVVLALAGCGGDDDGGGAEAGGGPSTPGALPVHAKDSLEFDRELYQADAGEITFDYISDGSLPHTLVVEGHEDDLRLEVSEHGTDSGSIDLPEGTYTIYCDVAGHRGAGMEATLQVG